MTRGSGTARPDGLWWVDDSGKWRYVDPQSGKSHISRPFGNDPAGESVGYRAMGCVKVGIFGARISVTWDVREVAPSALDEILSYLDCLSDDRRIVLTFFYEGWNGDDPATPARAIERIERTAAFRSIELIDTVLIERRPLGVTGNASPMIESGIDVWERSGGAFGKQNGASLDSLLTKLVLFTPREGDGRLMFSHTGTESGFSRIYGSDWAHANVGLPSDFNRPDQFYAHRVSEAYGQVMVSGEPRLDHVRALIHREDGEPVWAPYQRLLAPCRLQDGSPALMCLSSLTQRISIPFLGAPSG